MLYYQNFPYVLEIICLELISYYYNNFFVERFGIDKT